MSLYFKVYIIRFYIDVFNFTQLQLGNMETGAVSKKADPKSIASRVLTCPGPFSTVRLAQSSISGHIRPAAVTIVDRMQNLERDGLGKVMVVDRTTVFYKSLPCNVDEEVLGNYGVILGNYSNQFKERAAHTIVSRDLFNRMLNMSPDKVDLERVYAIIISDQSSSDVMA